MTVGPSLRSEVDELRVVQQRQREVHDRVFLSRATVTELEEEFVLNALRSGWVAPLGPDVDAFEREMADRVGVSHALALSSGTAALHLALMEVGARPWTSVIVPSMTFAATANAVVYTGAEPIFVDSDEHGNVRPEFVDEAIRRARHQGRPVVAIVSVDLFGRCADYRDLEAVAADAGIPLLEDAAEGLGASQDGRQAGSFGLAAALSFNGNKIMTTSGGGMLLSDDGALIERCRYLSTQARQPLAHYEHTEVGYNYRLSNILAALGRAQLIRLDEMVSRRREIRAAYREGFAGVPGLRVLGGPDDAAENCWLTCIEVAPDVGRPKTIMHALEARNVESRPLWKPMHLQPAFSRVPSVVDGTSQLLFERGLALPSGPEVSHDDVDRVIDTTLRAVSARV